MKKAVKNSRCREPVSRRSNSLILSQHESMSVYAMPSTVRALMIGVSGSQECAWSYESALEDARAGAHREIASAQRLELPSLIE